MHRPGEVAKAVEHALKSGYRHIEYVLFICLRCVPLHLRAATLRSDTALQRNRSLPICRKKMQDSQLYEQR